VNKREFVCRAALKILMVGNIESDDCWACAERFWDERPQWMKDEDAPQEERFARLNQRASAAAAFPEPKEVDLNGPNVTNAMPPPAAWPNGNPGASAPGC